MLESGKLKYRRDFVQVVGVAANDAMLDCQVDAAQLRLKLLLGRLLRHLGFIRLDFSLNDRRTVASGEPGGFVVRVLVKLVIGDLDLGQNLRQPGAMAIHSRS